MVGSGVEPDFQCIDFLPADLYAVLIGRIDLHDDLSVEIRLYVLDGIGRENHLPVGPEKQLRVELFLQLVERIIDDVRLPVPGHRKGDFLFRIEIGDVRYLDGIEFPVA